jgi:hypothetical protein
MATKDCKTCGPTTYVPEAKLMSVEEPVMVSIENKDGDIVQVDWRQTAYNVKTIVSVLEIEDVPATIIQEEEGKLQ